MTLGLSRFIANIIHTDMKYLVYVFLILNVVQVNAISYYIFRTIIFISWFLSPKRYCYFK